MPPLLPHIRLTMLTAFGSSCCTLPPGTILSAAAHPIKNAHSIWELVLHIAAWDDVVRHHAFGKRAKLTAKQNFPPVEDTSEAAWRTAVEHTRWDEKAGLRRDAVSSQVIDALEAQEIKETGNEED